MKRRKGKGGGEEGGNKLSGERGWRVERRRELSGGLGAEIGKEGKWVIEVGSESGKVEWW